MFHHPDGLILVVDKGYRDPPRRGLAQGQLDLEQHGGRTPAGAAVRVLQHLLAMTAAIWHNWHTGQPVMRSLIAYDH